MDKTKAKKILNLKDDFTPDDLKKNYRKLAMLYHPDKCNLPDSNERFNDIQSAYSYLSGKNDDLDKFASIDDLLKNVFMNFTNLNTIPIRTFKVNNNINNNLTKKKLYITPKEYFTGITKSIEVFDKDCNCENILCDQCSGCGYSLDFNVCMNCIGEGWIKTCSCTNKRKIDIVVPSCINLDTPILVNYKSNLTEYLVELNDSMYFYQNGNIYYKFDISLKESLIGFNKKFKDPFGIIHDITIKNKIIKQDDGYSLNIGSIGSTLSTLSTGNIGNTLIILFNIIYPPKLTKEQSLLIEQHF